jgi:endoglucanase
MRLCCLLLFAFSFHLAHLQAADAAPNPGPELISNGGFDVDGDGDRVPDGWSIPGGVSYGTDGFVRFESTGRDSSPSLSRQIAIGDAKALKLTFRVRYQNVKRGAEGWNDARILIDCKDATGKKLAGGPGHPYFTGTSAEWVSREVLFRVPEGTATVSLMPGIFQANSGTFDIDDLSLVAIAPESIPVAEPINESQLVVDAGGAAPLALHTEGTQVLDSAGTPVWLQGVNVPSLEWSNGGERVLASVIEAVDGWKANVIRLPVKADRWFGRDKGQKDDGAAYRALVDQAVLACSSRGARLILDLHHYRAPKEAEAEFWRSAAAHFAANPAVLFGLLNEPHDVTWEVWKNGGEVTDRKRNTDALAENTETITSFTALGMQDLVDAVRETGATNIVLVGGLDWAYDLSGMTAGFALDDRGGSGIIYDTHVYPWKSQWQERFLDCAAVYPVLLGEVGCPLERMSFIPPERHEDPYTWAPDMLACIQKHRLHWTGWSFHPGASPCILQNAQSYTPTPYWGAFVRAALRGATWTSDTLR